MKTIFTIILLVSPALAQDNAAASRAQAACGPRGTQFDVKVDTKHALAEPDSGKALVYVVEDQKTKYIRDVTLRVGLDGAWMGANRGDSYLFFAVDPGVHHLCADWQTFLPFHREPIVALASFTGEAGKTYYFRARNWGDASSWVLDLDEVNEDQGRLLVARSGFSVSSEKKAAAPTSENSKW